MAKVTSKASWCKTARISVEVHNCPWALILLSNCLTWHDWLLDHRILAVIVGSDARIIISGRTIDALMKRLITSLLKPKELLCQFFYISFTIFMSFTRFHLHFITIQYCSTHDPIFSQNIIFSWLAFCPIRLIFYQFIEVMNFN